MNKICQKLIYALGFVVSVYNVTEELASLEHNLPPEYYHRQITDLGCGDGRISKKLIALLQPTSYVGYDISPALLHSASKKGLQCEKLDVEKQSCSGDLGILWGVLHHFQNPATTLKKLSENFRSLLIREPLDQSRWIELGQKLSRTDLDTIFSDAGVQIGKSFEIEKNKSLIVLI